MPQLERGLLAEVGQVLALLLALFAPVNPNCYASRFSIVLLAAFAVLARTVDETWAAFAITGATALAVTPGSELVLYTLVNPCNPPRQILESAERARRRFEGLLSS